MITPSSARHRPPPPSKQEIDAFDHTLLANKYVRRGVRLADLGKEAGQLMVDGKFRVVKKR
jgi:hypothetical protein